MSSVPHWFTGQTIDKNAKPWIFGLNKDRVLMTLKTIAMFVLLFIILTLNFLALAISIQCNRGKPSIASSLYAFLFGPIYLFVNYYSVRILTQGKTCEFSTENPFSL